MEKQAVKARTKWRDIKRAPRKAVPEVETGPPVKAEPEAAPEARVYRPSHHQKSKPMTLEEALLKMDKTKDYMVYRDSETDKVSVLVRRRDGHFDLVEG